MSTIKVSAIQDLSGGTNVNVPNGPKAWVNFNGTGTVAIRANFNVSSITDNGTGDYTVNFTNALADADYALAGTSGVGNSSFVLNRFATTAPTASAARILCANDTGGLKDEAWMSVLFVR